MNEALTEWLGMLRKSAFINDYVAEKYTKRLMALGVCTIVFMFASAVVSACSVSLLGTAIPSSNVTNDTVLTDDVAVWVTIAFNIATLIITAALGAIHSIKELFGWEAFVREIKEYVTDAIKLSGTIEIQLSLGAVPTKDFVDDFSRKMIDFRNGAPNIGASNFIEGEQRWNDYMDKPKTVETMMICNQRFPHHSEDHDIL
jgi:hypothetical protein